MELDEQRKVLRDNMYENVALLEHIYNKFLECKKSLNPWKRRDTSNYEIAFLQMIQDEYKPVHLLREGTVLGNIIEYHCKGEYEKVQELLEENTESD